MEKRLITSALPYVNNIPHLGNLIQVLSADVFARYCRLRGYKTLYICGTDEYGTATETKALEEGITPKELCDRYYTVHKEIYEWFNISFDLFGRTSTDYHKQITQDIFLKLDKNGYISEKTIEQLYCNSCSMFLADRYVLGTCPHCAYEDARGDQCENCGKLLDPTELKQPRCSTCGNKPVIKRTNHLYIDLPAILPGLQEWMKTASNKGFWSNNAIQMTQAWIRDGLRERCITRDLKWGIPVPKKSYEDKVFYVWFDAPVGYISITANLTEKWEDWWKNPEETHLFQFIGKDNIPFHTVIFPSSLLGSGDPWTLLYHMSSTEYLNYENGKFSKSKGMGVFGNDAKDTGIPADVWRFYIYYNRPEKSDAQFLWHEFQLKVNGELIGNLSNLINRTFSFVHSFFKGRLPENVRPDSRFWDQVKDFENDITAALEKVELRDAFRKIFQLSDLGNKRFQDEAPWKTVKESPQNTQKAASLLNDLLYLIRDLAILIHPYMPGTSDKIMSFLGIQDYSWDDLAKLSGIDKLNKQSLLFQKLEDREVVMFKERFSGSQKERNNPADQFRNKLDLRVARIDKIERHPKADKLYVKTISLGKETRQIVSGLVPYYSEDELLGKNIILVYNLKPAKIRGVESRGMLLAAMHGEIVEVIFAPQAKPGDRVVLEGESAKNCPEPGEISIDDFFDFSMRVENFIVMYENKALTLGNKPLKVKEVRKGKIG
jgi:methionyl-tRNA synthetase